MPTLSPFIGARLDSFHRFHLFRRLVSAGYLKNHLEWRSKKNRICEPPASIRSSRGDSSQAAMGVLRSLSTRNKPWNCQRRRHSPTEKTRIFFSFWFQGRRIREELLSSIVCASSWPFVSTFSLFFSGNVVGCCCCCCCCLERCQNRSILASVEILFY